jgi:hypothetical protein
MHRVDLSLRRRGGRHAKAHVGRLLFQFVSLAFVSAATVAYASEARNPDALRPIVVATATHDAKPATASMEASKSKATPDDAAPAESPESPDEAQPIRLAYVEGDLAGMSSILSEDGKTVIGMIDYRQHLRGDVLEIVRIARFADGSSDEDEVRAHVGKTLRAIGGRSIIRNTKGVTTVSLEIDVAKGRLTGFSGLGKERKDYDQEAELSPATYWGPLVGILLKNFDKNAVDGKLRFHTVVATPKPRAFHMELVREEKTSLTRVGSKLAARRFSLSPSINILLDPLLKMVVPKTDFFMQAGHPPALARFAGPRNYADQKIRIE